MAVFDKMFSGMLVSLGLSPDTVQHVVKTVLDEIEALRVDREGFRAGAGNVVAELRGRMDRLEVAVNNILATQEAILAYLENHAGDIPHINGVTHDER